MILIDTSIWIDHLRQGDLVVERMLRNRLVLVHPFVIGEIALGNFKHRADTLASLAKLGSAKIANDDEVLELIETETLFGTGIGYVDVHLLASTRLTLGSSLWTRDKRLKLVADRLNVATAIN